MRFRALIFVAVGAAAAAAGFWSGAWWHRPAEVSTVRELWTCSMHPQVLQDKPGACPICGMQLAPVRKVQDPTGTPNGKRKIRYWWDPMLKPPYISDKPGKSPMGIDLIPVYEDEVRAGPVVTIDPVLTQNMGIRVAAVEEGPLTLTLRTVGYLREAEPRRHDITLKVDGWIERLHAATEGMFVKEGDPLFDLYSPDLLIAQEELLSAQRALNRLPPGADELLKSEAARLVDGGRQKLALWGVPGPAIDEMLRSGKATATLTWSSPVSGFVTEKSVVQGSAVEARTKIFRIVDQSELWIDAQIYQTQIPHVRVGQKARALVQGRDIEGEVVFVSPAVDPQTRAAVARLSFPNANLLLRPGMFATIDMAVEAGPRALLVPREAVIDTGLRQVAFVVLDQGRFEPRKVRMGLETGDGRAQILEGLKPGERVVVSGQFLLDSESRLREAIEKMTDVRLLAAPPQSQARADTVLAPYLDISRGLVKGRVASREKIAALAEAARRLSSDEVGAAASGLRDQGLKDQREGFKELSGRMIDLLRRVPATRAAAPRLFIIHCPMAHADWIQDSDEIANPYYGDVMPDCGAVKEVIETVSP